MNLNQIKILPAFEDSKPSYGKVRYAINYLKQYHELDKLIVVNPNGYLIDGYIRYVALNKLGKSNVELIKIGIDYHRNKLYTYKETK